MKLFFRSGAKDNFQKNNFKKNKMNNFTKVLFIAIAMFGFATSSFAQVSATASSTATIIEPITIEIDQNMNFGNLAVSATGGTVVLSPAAAALRDVTGGGAGVTLPKTKGTVQAASFTIGGQAGYTYAVTLPTEDITLSGSVSGDMTLGTFTSSNDNGEGTVGSTLYVGGTLTVDASEVAGTYTNDSDLSVTVNYN